MAYLPAGRASGSRPAQAAHRVTHLTCAVHAALAFAAVSAATLPLADQRSASPTEMPVVEACCAMLSADSKGNCCGLPNK